MYNFKALYIALCVGGLSACASSDLATPKPADTYKDLKITLDRRSCLGPCPSYVVQVNGNGNVAYCGFFAVEEKGRRTRQIDPNKVQTLYNKILSADFFDLRDEYRTNMTDSPSYTVTVSVDGLSKTVIDYVGREAGMPKSVTDIQDSIDKIAGTSTWIGNIPSTLQLGGIDTNIPDCEDEFRPGAKAFRKKMDEWFKSRLK